MKADLCEELNYKSKVLQAKKERLERIKLQRSSIEKLLLRNMGKD